MKILLIVFIPLALIVGPPIRPQLMELSGRCVEVLDGDTIIVKIANRRERVRLRYIDAPELSQINEAGVPVGKLTKDYLDNLVMNKKVTLKKVGRGYYKRYLAEVWQGKTHINWKIILNGMAWVYKRASFYSVKNKNQFMYAFDAAKNQARGIWSKGAHQAPWYYRRKMKRLKYRTSRE